MAELTLLELINEVALLAGTEDVEDREWFIFSANRALSELYNSVTVPTTVCFNVRNIKPISHYKTIVCKAGERLKFPLVGTAFSMRICGSGYYAIVQGNHTTVNQFDTGIDSKIVQAFISSEGTIEFWGSFTFMVYDLAMYDEAFSPKPQNIPVFSPVSTFNLRERYPDFMSFLLPATDREGKIIKSCRLYNGTLEVDSSFNGELNLTYRKKPMKIIDEGEGEDEYIDIDIPEEYAHILVYLTAYHYLLISDADKAKTYQNIYEDLVKNLSGYYHSIELGYPDVNGWAK